jgi:hypothetical protein
VVDTQLAHNKLVVEVDAGRPDPVIGSFLVDGSGPHRPGAGLC